MRSLFRQRQAFRKRRYIAIRVVREARTDNEFSRLVNVAPLVTLLPQRRGQSFRKGSGPIKLGLKDDLTCPIYKPVIGVKQAIIEYATRIPMDFEHRLDDYFPVAVNIASLTMVDCLDSWRAA